MEPFTKDDGKRVQPKEPKVIKPMVDPLPDPEDFEQFRKTAEQKGLSLSQLRRLYSQTRAAATGAQE